jgi:hypothetical protein
VTDPTTLNKTTNLLPHGWPEVGRSHQEVSLVSSYMAFSVQFLYDLGSETTLRYTQLGAFENKSIMEDKVTRLVVLNVLYYNSKKRVRCIQILKRVETHYFDSHVNQHIFSTTEGISYSVQCTSLVFDDKYELL